MNIVFPYDGYEHLGIGYLAAVAIKGGHEATLCRMRIGDYISGYRPLQDEKIDRERDRLLAEKPDIVAFSLASPCAGSMIEIAKRLRRAGVKTVAGGPHATAEPELTLQEDAFDGLITGEAEEVFIEALEAIVRPGRERPEWLYTVNHAASQNQLRPDINTLPFPAKELFYRQTPYFSDDYLVISSRGCPYACIYCAKPPNSSRYVQRSPDSLLRELMWAKNSFSPHSVYFMDDVFGLDAGWLREFLPLYRKKIILPFHAIMHPRHLDDEKAALMRESGCYALRIGVQTLTPHVRKRLGRPENDEQVKAAIDSAKKNFIRVEIDHMIDLPGETMEDVRKAVRFYSARRPDAIKVYWLMPLPGSRWFVEAQQEGRLSKERADLMRRGKGFGTHSYLFRQENYSNPSWLGLAAFLAYLPFLPTFAVRFFLFIRIERFIGIASFPLLVGISRLLYILHGKDRVGEFQLRRIANRIIQRLHKLKS